MPLKPLSLPGCTLSFDPTWLAADAAWALYAALRAQVPWETHHIRLFGREVASPRRSCWIGDAGAAYRYSGTLFEPRPWPEVLQPIRSRLAAELGGDFNSVLANRYRDGRDAMGWHRDDEPELGAQPVIASLSLGATRRFVLKTNTSERCELALPHGSLLVMAGQTQRHAQHALPRTAEAVGERINLTFRRIGVG